MNADNCLVCQMPAVEEVSGFSALPRITSDCRPYVSGGRLGICAACGTVQKYPDAAWLAEIQDIYAAYFAHHQGGGDEQLVLDKDTGTLVRRSNLILRHLVQDGSLPSWGSALDVGCGTGGTLQAMSEALAGWRLYAQDLDARQEGRLRRIAGFERIFTGSITDLPRQFDLISMVHSLEHFPSPRQALVDLKPKLAPDGRLFVEVVDCEQNPFDLLVADHIIHFDKITLGFLAERAGYRLAVLRNDWVLKELSLVAVSQERDLPPVDLPSETVRASQDRVRRQLAWLDETVNLARRHARSATDFGVFGTSIAGTWLTGFLADHISFYVDEDQSRIGHSFMGKPVLHPREVAPSATVFLALSPALASKIADRMGVYGFRIVAPPSMRT